VKWRIRPAPTFGEEVAWSLKRDLRLRFPSHSEAWSRWVSCESVTAMAPFEATMGGGFQRGDIARAKTQVGFKAAATTRAEEMFKERTVGLKTKEE